MIDPKKKKSGLKKAVRKVEDDLGVDETVEDIVDGILSIFDDDDSSGSDDDSSDDSDSSDDDDDDFGGGDFGGGGASDDW